jgi:hypothetical protein
MSCVKSSSLLHLDPRWFEGYLQHPEDRTKGSTFHEEGVSVVSVLPKPEAQWSGGSKASECRTRGLRHSSAYHTAGRCTLLPTSLAVVE